ncbi:hypothetical protein LVD17_08785 [Fulvivirga ulvae]|uniref:hypothetical protein n=1 Tax=Fulvivirga ulvae TaxID=2904245 RepID=UPI001F247556|nr:hypothetical protein [Fulvivirga ulvae]UII33909.1 hypothetical protein LVD17_08785 [Fulvivirga ulvae]
MAKIHPLLKNCFLAILRFLSIMMFSMQMSYAQQNITVSEGTLKVNGVSEQEFYFGLSEGDELLMSLKEIKGKELKEIEVMELPSNSKYIEYKSSTINNKAIQIQNTGIYKLRLKNSALGGRVCRYKLERKPADSSKKFNSTVYWNVKYDTVFYTVQEDYLASIDTAVISVIGNKVERVHSQTATNGKPNRSIVQVALPPNTVSWSYYIGVGEDSEAIFQQAEEKAIKRKSQLKAATDITQSLASFDGSGSSALALLALKGYAEFGIPAKANNIQYWFVSNHENVENFMQGNQFFQFEMGNGPLSYKRMENPKAGTFYICLLNDNLMEGIDVHIRVSAVTIKENWQKRNVEKYRVNSWKEPYLKN